jgi:hypothetical protein
LHTFAQRIRAQRGSNVAKIAVARKLCVLCWQLLSREQDYAYARPSLTKAKLRRHQPQSLRFSSRSPAPRRCVPHEDPVDKHPLAFHPRT